MMNPTIKLLPLFALAALVSCSSDDTTTPAPADVVISSTGSTTTIDEAARYNLTIDGDGNTITIEKFNFINTLTLSGSNNLITFSGTNDVGVFNVSGNDNSVFASDSITTTVTFTTDSGSGNSLTLQ